jgi:hypothetical protein
MPPRPPPIVPPLPPGQKFRAAIEQAKSDGQDPSTMMLRLTLGDVSRLKRDPSIAANDISFSGDEMRYLGVKVTPGGVETSALVFLQS